MKRAGGWAIFLTFMVAAPSALAGGLNLQLPVDCIVGETCFIQNYMDHDSKPDVALDYACGRLSYDGHNGTDFRVPTYADMDAGINVLAAANGHVRRLRYQNEIQPDDIPLIKLIKTRLLSACGASVTIEHGTGWSSTYCHLDPNSITVKYDDYVESGHVIAQMGKSGESIFPHVHYELRHYGKPVDPFVGYSDHFSCDSSKRYSQWSKRAADELYYIPTGLIKGAFSAELPDAKLAREGGQDVEQVDALAPQMHFWVELYGLRQYDRLHIELIAPDGAILATYRIDYEEPFAVAFEKLQAARSGESWPQGIYTAKVTLTRFENVIPDRLITQQWQVEVE